MTDDPQSAAHRIIEAVAREHPDEAATIASLVLFGILDFGLHGDNDPVVAGEFVRALNDKLIEIAQSHGSSRVWRLVAFDPPREP